jgi:hypothetical protein
MKKFYLIAALAFTTLAASAQQKLYLSTYNGTNLEQFDGKMCDVSVSRYVFTGWNTIALPFNLDEAEVNTIFGDNCRLEKLVAAEQSGNSLVVSFQDCKEEGMKANTPYILYYSGEPGTKKIAKHATVADGEASISVMVKGSAETVTMSAAKSKLEGTGLYGVLARDNSEAKFVKVGDTANIFYATRCYIKLSQDETTQLITRHLAAGETTGIAAVAAKGERVDVYTVGGQKVASDLNASQVNSLKPGIYVVKGQKILVK